ncbi:MAG: EamA family transporter [Alphaproteobacteria bacterium]|nr:EamA family transporter [Alphaproteobacteria bacterium]
MTVPSPQTSPATVHRRGVAIVVLGVLVLTPDGLLTTLVSADIWTMIFWRGLLMALALTAFSLIWRRQRTITRRAILNRSAVGISLLFAVSSVAFVTAIVTTGVANTLFLITAAPLFAAAFARVFFKEPIAPRTIVAIVVVMAGMAIIFGDGLGRGNLLGNLSAVFAAACWAGSLVLLRHSPQTDAPLAIAGGGYLIAAIALIFAPALIPSPADALWLGLLGLIVLPVSFGLISLGPRYLPAPEVSLIVLLEAVIGPLWAWAFIGQVPTATSLAGGALIIATLAVYFYVSRGGDQVI